MKTGQERKNYWNEKYYEYWKSRVDEAGGEVDESAIIQGDSKTEDDSVYEEVFEAHPFLKGNLLEVGCAWGRMFRVYQQYGVEIHGVDISKAMIDAAKKIYTDDPQIKSIQESEAEKVPFDDAFFDNLSCLATFDATFQKETLREFLRVLKMGGNLYLTGKGADYPADDQQAMDAEIGARGKGHPNFFTDVPRMVDLLQKNGHRIQASYYYPRRGDFGRNHYETQIPDKFYEWFLVIQKGSDQIDFDDFADSHSNTFRQTQK